MIKMADIITEVMDIENFLDYYKKRTEELRSHYGYEGYVIGEFQFEMYNKDLFIMCDVVHSDTITNASEMVEDNRFTIPNSVNKKIYTLQPFNFNVNNFIDDVILAL